MLEIKVESNGYFVVYGREKLSWARFDSRQLAEWFIKANPRF